MGVRLRSLAYGLAGVLSVAGAREAAAQTLTVQSIGQSGALGNLVSAPTAAGTLTIAPSSGAIVMTGAARLSSGSDKITVTIKCGAQNACNNTNTQVTIQPTGSPVNRLGVLTNFTVAMGTATLVTPPGTGGTISFVLGPIGKNSSKTFYVGLDAPVLPDTVGNSGSASSSFQVRVGPSPGSLTASGSATLSAKVFRPISVSKVRDMAFGDIVKPNAGSGTVTLTPAGVLTTTAGVILTSSLHQSASFAITGEGGQVFSLVVPTSFVMTSGANSLTVTTSASTSGGSLAFGGALGSGGSLGLTVGGQFGISASTPSGAYVGSLVVTVSYN